MSYCNCCQCFKISGSRGVKTLETSITYLSLLSFPWKYPLSCAAFLRPLTMKLPLPPTQVPSSRRLRCCAGLATTWSRSGGCAACSGSTWRPPSSSSWPPSSWWAGSWASSGGWTWSSWQVSTPLFIGVSYLFVFHVCVCVCIISWLLLFPCWQVSQAVVFWDQWDAFSCYQLTRLPLK